MTEPMHSPEAADRTGAQTSTLDEDLQSAVDTVNRVVLDKPEQVRLVFAALLAGGHVLVEDLPGVGKTTLAHAIAEVVDGQWHRVQFTSDLLPADILGVSIWNREHEQFEFRPGPIFANVVLADEINRATPRTQSALLEAMAEGQVSIDGTTHPLPQPFFVIGTQNPLDLAGTYALPDSQLDRFLVKISLGYPDQAHERSLLIEPDRKQLLEQIQPQLTIERLQQLVQLSRCVHVSEPVLDYIQALVQATREHPAVSAGLSTRAAIALVRVSQAYAKLAAMAYVLPDHVQAVFPALAEHRLHCKPNAGDRQDIVNDILANTAVDRG
ncbi:MAG: MoxR family ATPase [Pseudomonadota bacterium]